MFNNKTLMSHVLQSVEVIRNGTTVSNAAKQAEWIEAHSDELRRMASQADAWQRLLADVAYNLKDDGAYNVKDDGTEQEQK